MTFAPEFHHQVTKNAQNFSAYLCGTTILIGGQISVHFAKRSRQKGIGERRLLAAVILPVLGRHTGMSPMDVKCH